MAESFKGEIVVASRIVDYLSSGLYESPSACLKELVNNSYDADATLVEMFVKPDADRIIISDDGCGMDRADFLRHFTRISESYKRTDDDLTDRGRPKIGKIGIGFIAANEVCETMEVVSTKKGSTERIEVSINFDEMRKPLEERRRGDAGVSKADFIGTVAEAPRDDHYTHVFLKRVKGEARQILVHAGNSEYTGGKRSLYGLGPASIAEELRSPEIGSWSDFDPYSRNLLEVGLNVPVRYHEDWIPSEAKRIREFTREVAARDFTVVMDGTEVRKPVVFRPGTRHLVVPFDFDGDHVAARGYFYAQHGALKPQELRGLLVRIRGAAVGEYDSSFLGFSPTRGPLFQSWISAEVWADDRLEDAMNIDRRTLRVAHPAFAELQAALHEALARVLSKVRSEIYGSGSAERKAKKASTSRESILEAVQQGSTSLSSGTTKAVRGEWERIESDPDGQKLLLQKFTVAELYDVVLAAASETLEGSQLDRFVRALTERLKKR